MIELKNWSFTGRGKYAMLCGNIYGSPKFTDGLWAHTAPVMKLQREENGFAITAGTVLYHCAFADHQTSGEDLTKWLPLLPGNPFSSGEVSSLTGQILSKAKEKALTYEGQLSAPAAEDLVLEVDASVSGYLCSENPEKFGVGFMTYDAHRLEFFHFPEDGRRIWVRNVGKEDMEAAGQMGLFLVKPGQVLPIEAQSPLGRISEHISTGSEKSELKNIRNF